METPTAQRQKKACRSFEELNEGHCDFGNEGGMKNGTIGGRQRSDLKGVFQQGVLPLSEEQW